ncbi:MAG: CmcJ/NvfI family oxidoreductase, partial [Pseudomonadota bacterium]
PVEQPVMTSPLGFIRPRSMQPEDWVTIDLVYTDRKGEILGVAANQHHEWLYRSQMTPDEVVIFNTYDNDGLPFVGHSALDMERTHRVSRPRKSIETRTIVRY